LQDTEEKSTGRNRKYLSRTDQERRKGKREKKKGKMNKKMGERFTLWDWL